MNGLSIAGAGSWGTALSIALSSRFPVIRLWAHDPELARQLRTTRENFTYLPGIQLPANVEPGDDLAHALAGSEMVLLVVPSQHLRGVCRQMTAHLCGTEVLISATKGIEDRTLCRMSELVKEEIGGKVAPRIAVLSGPTFAREIARGEPAAVVISSEDRELACGIQQRLATRNLRLYTNTDPAGVETGAALKNVIAIAAGIIQGLGLGSNTLAALITRGLAEITRLAVAMGGRPATLAGLAGLGDLVLTCTGDLSRNRQVGIELSRGRKLDEILGSTRMIPEGVATTRAAVELAHRYRIEMPITAEMELILRHGKAPQAGIRDLMERSLTAE